MRIWVLENGLKDQLGHHFNNSLGLARECAHRGIETKFLVHCDAVPEVVTALHARPVFRFLPYDQVSTDPLAGFLESFLVQGGSFAEGFDAASGMGLTNEDVIFVPMATQHELYGCALGINSLSQERRPALIVNFVIENFLVPGKRELGWNACLYRFAIRELERSAHHSRILLTANGQEMAARLGEVLGKAVNEYPMLKSYPPAIGDSGLPIARPKVAILGHSRSIKGFQFVPELVQRHPRLDFLVQVSPPEMEELWGAAATAVRTAPNVELVRGTLDESAYHQLLARADIVLLPYDAAWMPLRSSGVFSEAVAAAKVVVVPKNTWMSAHLAAGHGAGVGFSPTSVATVSNALDTAAKSLSMLQAAARKCAIAWRTEQCVGAYFDRALSALDIH